MGRVRRGLVVSMLAMAVLTACSGLPRPSAPAGPTPVPEPPQVRDLFGRGVQIDGHGTAQTDDITPQYGGGGVIVGINVATVTHDGHSTFILTAVQGDQTENVVSAIGAYTGQRPLVVEGPVSFEVTADGAWSVKIQPLSSGGSPSFSGSGDAVSPYFTPPAPGNWNVAHDGQSSFFVYAHCVGGSVVVEDKTGAVHETIQIQFPRGPCFWEVRADAAFSLAPA